MSFFADAASVASRCANIRISDVTQDCDGINAKLAMREKAAAYHTRWTRAARHPDDVAGLATVVARSRADIDVGATALMVLRPGNRAELAGPHHRRALFLCARAKPSGAGR